VRFRGLNKKPIQSFRPDIQSFRPDGSKILRVTYFKAGRAPSLASM